MAQSSIIECLHEIAGNLWWAWQPDVWQIFREIEPNVWVETNHNPIAFLKQVDDDLIHRRAQESALASRIRSARRRLGEYVADKNPRANMEAGSLYAAPVAYFCAEFGIHESLPIYSGGLGVLAGDHMKSSSDLAVPIVGVGLLYAMGYFLQTIDENGWQQEVYGRTTIEDLPVEKVLVNGKPLEVVVEASDGPIRVHVWKAPVGRNVLYLLDADVEGNKPSDRELTHTLYGGDTGIRIRQELLLGVGGVRVLDALGIRPGVIHLNEGHSAFAPLEACRMMMEQEGASFEEARERVARKTVFTTHTPVPAGHDRFSPELLEQTVGPLRESLGLDPYQFHGFGRINPDNPNETFCMTVLAMKFSRYRNGVSHLHGHVSRDMWKGLWPQHETGSIPIGHITNGVHTSTFLAPQMKAVFDRHLPTDWQEMMDQPEAWAGVRNVDPGEFWETHQILKSNLLGFLKHRMELQHRAIGGKPGEEPGHGFSPDVLTIGFARRFATYKRATLFMDDLDRILQIVADADRPVQFIVAGKAHPKDDGGKSLIQAIWQKTYDPAFKGRVAFIANYDLNVGRKLVQGVDVWLNNPRRPQEACGTSGQKTVLNGVLNCSILDGWWAEGYDGANGFAIGGGQEFAAVEDQDRHDAAELYRVLEEEVIPLYYDRDESGIPLNWVNRMKWGVESLGWRFNANRMLLDYLRNAYLPAVGATATGQN